MSFMKSTLESDNNQLPYKKDKKHLDMLPLYRTLKYKVAYIGGAYQQRVSVFLKIIPTPQ